MKKDVIKTRLTRAEHELSKIKARQMGASVSEFLSEALKCADITTRQYDAAIVKAKNINKSDLMRMIVFRAEVKTRLTQAQVDAILALADAINSGRSTLSETEDGVTLVGRLNELMDKLLKLIS